MKAQGLRSTLTLANVLLGLGIAGAGAWYVMKVRPAAADDTKRGAWVKAAMDTYQSEAKNATPTTVYPVREKELEAITRPDLMDTKKGAPGVWPFVGPVPPEPPPPAKEGPKVEAPKGLSALGHVGLVILDSNEPKDSTLGWIFNGPTNKRRTFTSGDLIEDKDLPKGEEPPKEAAPRKPGMYLLSVEAVEGEVGAKSRRYKVVYEVVGADPKDVRTAEEIVSTKEDTGAAPTLIRPAAGTPEAEALAAKGAAPVILVPGVPPPLTAVHIVPVSTADNTFQVDPDETALHYFRNSEPEKLIGDIKTEEVKDDKGQPSGVKITGIGKDNVVSQFGVVPGDVLKMIDGKPVHSRAEAIEVVKHISPDVANVQVVLERNGRSVTYNVDPRDPKVRAAAGKVKFNNK